MEKLKIAKYSTGSLQLQDNRKTLEVDWKTKPNVNVNNLRRSKQLFGFFAILYLSQFSSKWDDATLLQEMHK